MRRDSHRGRPLEMPKSSDGEMFERVGEMLRDRENCVANAGKNTKSPKVVKANHQIAVQASAATASSSSSKRVLGRRRRSDRRNRDMKPPCVGSGASLAMDRDVMERGRE